MKRPTDPVFPQAGLDFLAGLARHNRRDWFEAHREAYERDARAPMRALVGAVNDVLATASPACVTDPARALLRMNRDLRFSKDKSPYRTSLGARFGPGGGRGAEGGGWYLGLSPAGVELGGGAHTLEPGALAALRRHLARDARAFRALAGEPRLVRLLGPLQGERLVRVPRGLPPDHPDADLLRLKQAYFLGRLPARLIPSPRLVAELRRRILVLAPFVNHLLEIVRS